MRWLLRSRSVCSPCPTRWLPDGSVSFLYCLSIPSALYSTSPSYTYYILYSQCGINYLYYKFVGGKSIHDGFTGQQDSNPGRVGLLLLSPCWVYSGGRNLLGELASEGHQNGRNRKDVFSFLRSRAITPDQRFATVSS